MSNSVQTMSLAVNISSCRAHKLPPSTGKTEAPKLVQNFYSAEKDHFVCQVSKIGSIDISIIKHTTMQTEVACLAHGPFCHFISSTAKNLSDSRQEAETTTSSCILRSHGVQNIEGTKCESQALKYGNTAIPQYKAKTNKTLE